MCPGCHLMAELRFAWDDILMVSGNILMFYFNFEKSYDPEIKIFFFKERR